MIYSFGFGKILDKKQMNFFFLFIENHMVKRNNF